MQYVTTGSDAQLEVLKFATNGFTFHWNKIGSTHPNQVGTGCNILTFEKVSEKDLGDYQCVVKERGKVVLTLYRILYGRYDHCMGV